MSGWPHKDFSLRIVDADTQEPVLTIMFLEGRDYTLEQNHVTGRIYECPLEVVERKP